MEYSNETNYMKGFLPYALAAFLVGIGCEIYSVSSVNGLYAAGDICIKPLRQVVTAASDGALAATELEKYVAKIQERTGLRTKDPVIREKVFGDKAEKVPGGDNETQGDGLFTLEMCTQLETFFDKMENPLMLKLCLDLVIAAQHMAAITKSGHIVQDKDTKILMSTCFSMPLIRFLIISSIACPGPAALYIPNTNEVNS